MPPKDKDKADASGLATRLAIELIRKTGVEIWKDETVQDEIADAARRMAKRIADGST